MDQKPEVASGIQSALARLKDPPKGVCPMCGEEFVVIRDAQSFCSNLCQQERYIKGPSFLKGE